MLAKHKVDAIRFRKNDNIGFADAEADEEILRNCFVETTDLTVLRNCKDPRCIVLGRTGSGKTALLKRLVETEEHCFELSPESLSLNYISNSNVIDFFESVGVNLDVFYKLLWNHVLAVELIKKKFDIINEASKKSFFTHISNVVRKNKKKEQALDYLNTWGERFWEETETRIKNLTKQIEEKFLASAGIHQKIVSLGAEGAKNLSIEEKTEIVQRGRSVVDSVQIRDLINVTQLLADDIFNDQQNNYFFLIDRLDEGWAEDKVRYKLIKALIESIKQFRKIENVKIIIAIRTDLKNRVIAETVSAGFQEEKYKSLYLNLRWTRGQIRNVLDQRVNFLFEKQYTKHNVFLKNILPTAPINGKDAVDYIIERTFLRPREAIIFLNLCIEKSHDEPRISIGSLRAAEVAYSSERLRSLEDEWRSDYPLLRYYTKILEHSKTPINYHELLSKTEEFIVGICGEPLNLADPIQVMACQCMEENAPTYSKFLTKLLTILYQVGVIGIKPDTHISRQWSYLDHPTIDESAIRDTARIEIHLTFWRVLGVVKQSHGNLLENPN